MPLNQENAAGMPSNQRPPLTFGEKLAGVSFNPSGNPQVDTIKRLMAQCADLVKESYSMEEDSSPLDRILYEHAIGEILNAQMSCVKILTQKY